MSITIVNQKDKPVSNKNLSFDTSNCTINLMMLAKIRIELYDVTIIKDFKITELCPYITINQGDESIKTNIGKKKNTHSYQFNEVMEIKKTGEKLIAVRLYHKTNIFTRDQLLGETNLEFTKLGKMDFTQIQLFDDINDMIAIMNVKIILKDANDQTMQLTAEPSQNLNLKYKTSSSRCSGDFTQQISSKNGTGPSYYQSNYIFIKDDTPNGTPSSVRNVNHIIQRQIEYQHSLKKGSGSEDFDFLSTQTESLKLDDIDKIKADLYEEKYKMRMEEMKMNKLAKILKVQEKEIDSEKKVLIKRKDYLTEQELHLLEEKRKLDALLTELGQQKQGFNDKKDDILTEYDVIHQSLTMLKSKNNVLIRKIDTYQGKIGEMKVRQRYLEETLINAEKKKPKPKSTDNSIILNPDVDPISPYNVTEGSEVVKDDFMSIQEIIYDKKKIFEVGTKLNELSKLEAELLERIREKEERKNQTPPAQSPRQTFKIGYSPMRDFSGNYNRSGVLDSGNSMSNANLNFSMNNSPVHSSIDYGQLLQRSNGFKK